MVGSCVCGVVAVRCGGAVPRPQYHRPSLDKWAAGIRGLAVRELPKNNVPKGYTDAPSLLSRRLKVLTDALYTAHLTENRSRHF